MIPIKSVSLAGDYLGFLRRKVIGCRMKKLQTAVRIDFFKENLLID